MLMPPALTSCRVHGLAVKNTAAQVDLSSNPYVSDSPFLPWLWNSSCVFKTEKMQR